MSLMVMDAFQFRARPEMMPEVVTDTLGEIFIRSTRRDHQVDVRESDIGNLEAGRDSVKGQMAVCRFDSEVSFLLARCDNPAVHRERRCGLMLADRHASM